MKGVLEYERQNYRCKDRQRIQYQTPLNIKNKINQNNKGKQIFNNKIQENSCETKCLTLCVKKNSVVREVDPEQPTLRHLLAKLLDFKDKESFNLALKVELQEKTIRLISDFHSNIQHLKTLEKCLKIPKDSTSQPRIFQLSKLASKYNDGRQTVWNLQKLKDCCPTVFCMANVQRINCSCKRNVWGSRAKELAVSLKYMQLTAKNDMHTQILMTKENASYVLTIQN